MASENSAPPNSPHERALALLVRERNGNLNEADTRHQIIDEVLHGVLSWPKALTGVESYIDPGYSDYYLARPDESLLLIIEAKKEGAFFELPDAEPSNFESRRVMVKTLMTDPVIEKAITQVHTYCVNRGCPFAAITNGHTWIFFRTFLSNQDWRNLNAFVVPSLKYFCERFSEATNSLGYKAIAENGSLISLLGNRSIEHREAFYPKDGINAYETSIYQNRYAQQLRPVMERYFQQLDERDSEFMKMCYVTDASDSTAFKSARARLLDAITPYFQQYPIRQIDGTEDGGSFSSRLQKSIREGRGTDVVVLFGGKGVGKSTFLRRLLFYKVPQVLKKHSIASIIDLINAPDIKEQLYAHIWNQLLSDLDKSGLLLQDRPALLELFSDKFELAQKQDLYGLAEGSESYNVQLNKLVQVWLNDNKYCAKKLAEYWARQHRRIIIVIDNTDQFSSQSQDFCFEVAHEISKELGCLSIISMREERFYASNIKGTLDAFHNSGFHISAPMPNEVFRRRLQYVTKRLSTASGRLDLLGEYTPDETAERILKLFRIFCNEFSQSRSHLASFLTACAHGNIRIALQMFQEFVLSRYTNVTEMTSVEDFWTIIIHQVLKPIMIPYRFFYDESESKVPNIYQVRARTNGSHFTALRILKRLAIGDPTNRPYIAVPTLATEFSQKFNMKEDMELNLDILLRYRLVEANNKIDEYTPQVDNVRITNYGTYLLTEMSRFFTYIELISTDCAIYDQQTANSLIALSNQEFMLWEAGLEDRTRRVRRVEKRLQKAEIFLNYLKSEEQREASVCGSYDEPLIIPEIISRFLTEKNEVLRSARKQRY